MDFKTFSADKCSAKPQSEKVASKPPVTEDNVRQVLNSVKGKSENEIMTEIFKRAAEGKSDGTFNIDALSKAAENIKPMLTAEQRKKLDDILEALK